MALPSCSDTWLSDNSVSWGITWPKLATSSTALLLLRPSTDVEWKGGARVEREHKVKDTAESPVAFPWPLPCLISKFCATFCARGTRGWGDLDEEQCPPSLQTTEKELLWFPAQVQGWEPTWLLPVLHPGMFSRCSPAPLPLTIESKSHYLHHIHGNHLPEKMQEFLATNQITITGSGCLRQGNKLGLFQGSVAGGDLSGSGAFVVELIQFISEMSLIKQSQRLGYF